jgi:hypothetical protein
VPHSSQFYRDEWDIRAKHEPLSFTHQQSKAVILTLNEVKGKDPDTAHITHAARTFQL